MGEEKKRLVAVKLLIGGLLKSNYIKEEGLRPNYVLTQENIRISRVNLMGIVISAEDHAGYSSIIIDDGSGKISVRSFEQNNTLKNFNPGESVLVIGRPREYNRELYVLLEIVRKLHDVAWLEVRKRELDERNRVIIQKDEASYQEERLEYVEDTGVRQKVYDLIKSADAGQGVMYDELLKQMPENDVRGVIEEMLKNGEIFDAGGGRLKIV